MPSVGTRKFWRPIDDRSTATPTTIIKNSGYVNVVLHGAYYWSKGSLWQRVFGGTDRISLVSKISYQAGADTVEAAAVQDTREVPAKRGSFLGLGRNVAIKVPATADALELSVELCAIQSDNLDTVLKLLSADEARKALELAPPVVGAVATMTSLVKTAFTNVSPQARLEATYPGIISTTGSATPLQDNRLVAGYLIVLAVEQESDPFLDGVDPVQLAVVGDGLRYAGKPVPYTYVIYDISFEDRRGANPRAAWADKFRLALRSLDALTTSADTEHAQLLTTAKQRWIEGSALLDADPNYIDDERNDIRTKALKDILDRYTELTSVTSGSPRFLESIAALTGSLEQLREMPLDERTLALSRRAEKYDAQLARGGMVWNLEEH